MSTIIKRFPTNVSSAFLLGPIHGIDFQMHRENPRQKLACVFTTALWLWCDGNAHGHIGRHILLDFIRLLPTFNPSFSRSNLPGWLIERRTDTYLSVATSNRFEASRVDICGIDGDDGCLPLNY